MPSTHNHPLNHHLPKPLGSQPGRDQDGGQGTQRHPIVRGDEDGSALPHPLRPPGCALPYPGCRVWCSSEEFKRCPGNTVCSPPLPGTDSPTDIQDDSMGNPKTTSRKRGSGTNATRVTPPAILFKMKYLSYYEHLGHWL